MNRLTTSVHIDCNPVEVFYYLDDVGRETEWQPSLRTAEQDPPGPSKVGTVKRYTSTFMGREVRNTWTVVVVEPGRRLVTESAPGSSIDARYEVAVEPDGAGARVTFTVEATPTGLLKAVPRALVEAAFRKELEASLAGLKARLEGRG